MKAMYPINILQAALSSRLGIDHYCFDFEGLTPTSSTRFRMQIRPNIYRIITAYTSLTFQIIYIILEDLTLLDLQRFTAWPGIITTTSLGKQTSRETLLTFSAICIQQSIDNVELLG